MPLQPLPRSTPQRRATPACVSIVQAAFRYSDGRSSHRLTRYSWQLVEHVIGDHEDDVTDGDEGALFTFDSDHAFELRGEVGLLGVSRHPCRLEQSSLLECRLSPDSVRRRLDLRAAQKRWAFPCGRARIRTTTCGIWTRPNGRGRASGAGHRRELIRSRRQGAAGYKRTTGNRRDGIP